MLTTFLLVALTAQPPPLKLASTGFTPVKVEAAVADLYDQYLSEKLAEHGLSVMTKAEVAALVGLERQKQLLGCADDSSCTAELAGALGADAVVMGTLGKLGSAYTVTVKVVRAKDGKTLSSRSGRPADDDALHGFLEDAAAGFAHDIFAAFPDRAPPQAASHARVVVPSIIGAVALVGGGALFALAKSEESKIRQDADSPYTHYQDMKRASDRGRTFQTASAVCLGAAVLAGGAALVLGLTSGAADKTDVTVALGPTSIGLAGRFP